MTDVKASIGPAAKDELSALPADVQRELNAHRDLYLKDPEAAHIWDPIVIGVPGGPVACLLLEYRGRKSGKTLHTVLQYYKLDDAVAVVASRGGTAENPTWYENLVANPECGVRIANARYRAVARTAQGDERARWWESITQEQPVQREYQARTSRVIPVVILELQQ